MEEVLEHHKKQEVCYTRPAYREARWERAVKVCGRARRLVAGTADLGTEPYTLMKLKSVLFYI